MKANEIPEELIDRLARAMHGFHAIQHGRFEPWDSVKDEEKNAWKNLAKSGLIGIAPFIDLTDRPLK